MVAIDMEMPKSCAECLFMSYSECLLNDEYIMDTAERDNDCPLKEIREAKNMAIKALEQEPILDKIRAEIIEEKDFAYADFEQYKVDCLGVDAEYVKDEFPQDDFRYGMERAIEIIDKYKAESEDKNADSN